MNKVMVKAIKSFYWGVFANQLKTPRSEPFEVTPHECKQLLDNKLVVIVTEEDVLVDDIENNQPDTNTKTDPELQSEPEPEPEPELDSEPEPEPEPQPEPVPAPEPKKTRAKRTPKAA
ncbi:hypothetical protein [Vibrio anguillarum]|uniref:hypothetical protein n=1 Tax=Vibrio anguillarum TaxID=55601 RepID=UPI00097E1D46|nr:hypothetical protein [Vibrio anguillarum]MBT2972311.1 hypothetical protein [Vibrio anguillarum]